MKRQKKSTEATTTTTTTTVSKKKSKKAAAKVGDEERNVNGVEVSTEAVVTDDNNNVHMEGNWEENWAPWLRGVVDEQMSWGSIWLPVWDVEYYMVEEAYGDMFSDVMWDDDIWNLKSINSIPNP